MHQLSLTKDASKKNFCIDAGVLYLINLPLPISVNRYLPYRYPTKEKKKYMNRFAQWEWDITKKDYKQITRFLFNKKWGFYKHRIAPQRFKISFEWHRKVYAQGGKVVMTDDANFAKLPIDMIAKFLKIDDCYFTGGEVLSYHEFNKAHYSFLAKISHFM